MAISLTRSQLHQLDDLITPLDPADVWILTDGGSVVRCDIEGMAKELEDAPQNIGSAFTLEALRAFRAAPTVFRPQ